MRVLSYVILPLATLAIGLRTWRLVHKRGWRKILPILSYYIAFYCVTSTLLLGLSYCSLYPGRMQQTICLMHSYGYSFTEIVMAVFMLAVLSELLNYTSRSRTAARLITVVGAVAVAATFALVVTAVASLTGSNYCLLFSTLAGFFTSVTNFIFLPVLLLLVLLRRRFTPPWEKSISLIVLGLAQLFLVEIVLVVAVFHGHLKSVSGVVLQVSVLIWWLLWWLALREAPEETKLAASG